MDPIDQLAKAALNKDVFLLRSLVQDFTRENIDWSLVHSPNSTDERLLAISASLAELLAARQNHNPPAWTSSIGSLAEPFYFLQSAENMKRLRELCETMSPEPLKRRRLYAPPNFLEFA